MDKEIIIEMLVRRRVSHFRSDYGKKEWIVMEDLLEEGEGVRKQLGRFKQEAQAIRFMVMFRDELRKHYMALFDVTVNPNCDVPKPTPLMIQKRMEQELIGQRPDPEPSRGHESNPLGEPF